MILRLPLSPDAGFSDDVQSFSRRKEQSAQKICTATALFSPTLFGTRHLHVITHVLFYIQLADRK